MKVKHAAVSGIIWMGGSRLATQILDQLFTIALARLLSPGDFGLMAMVAVFSALFFVFADMGLASPALIQRLDVDEETLSTAFWGNAGGGLILFGLAVGGSDLIARFYGQPALGIVFVALSVRFLFAGVSATHLALLQREMRFATLTWRNLISVVLGGLTGVGMALAGAGLWSLVGQALAASFSRAVLLWWTNAWRPRAVFSWAKFRQLWSFGTRVLGARIFGQVIKNADNLFIGKVFGSVLLGYYAFAYGLFLGPLVDVSIIVGRVAFAAFSRLQQDVARLRRGFMLTIRYISVVLFPALVGLMLVAPDFISVVFGAKWLPAAPVLRVLLIAGLLRSHLNLWGSIYAAMGHPGWLLRWSFYSACVYVPAFVVGLRWGIVGVAAGYTISTVLLMPPQLRLVQRLLEFGLREYLAAFWPAVAASIVMAAAVLVEQAWLSATLEAPLRLLVSTLVGGVTYVAALWLIKRDLVGELLRTVAEMRDAQGGREAGARRRRERDLPRMAETDIEGEPV